MPIDVPAPLLKAIKEQKCMLFVGSGLSSIAGYPTWSELIASLIEAAKKLPFARIAGLEEFEHQNDYFTLAEFARSTLGVGQYTALLRKK